MYGWEQGVEVRPGDGKQTAVARKETWLYSLLPCLNAVLLLPSSSLQLVIFLGAPWVGHFMDSTPRVAAFNTLCTVQVSSTGSHHFGLTADSDPVCKRKEALLMTTYSTVNRRPLTKRACRLLVCCERLIPFRGGFEALSTVAPSRTLPYDPLPFPSPPLPRHFLPSWCADGCHGGDCPGHSLRHQAPSCCGAGWDVSPEAAVVPGSHGGRGSG